MSDRHKGAALDVDCAWGSLDFMRAIEPHIPRINSLECAVWLGDTSSADEVHERNRAYSGISELPPPILETPSLENDGKPDPPPDVKFDTLPENPSSLRTLRLGHIPLTDQLLRLVTPTSFDISLHSIDLSTLLGFLAEIKSLEHLRILCRNVVGEAPCTGVLVPNIPRCVAFADPSRYQSPVLERLYLPPTANISIQVLPGGLFDPPIRNILSQFLDELPGIAQATSLQYGVTQSSKTSDISSVEIQSLRLWSVSRCQRTEGAGRDRALSLLSNACALVTYLLCSSNRVSYWTTNDAHGLRIRTHGLCAPAYELCT